MNPQEALNPGCSIMVNNIGEERLLLSHLKPNMRVLEFGHGLSTNVIAKMVRQVVSVEYNVKWYDEFKPFVDKNATVLLAPANSEPSADYDDGTFENYKNFVLAPMPYAATEKFDVVFIDGRARVACAEYAAKFYLKDDGLIVIHDYKHPQPPPYRRLEYEVVESFLDLKKHTFAMAIFVKKGMNSPYLDASEQKANIVALPSVSGVAEPVKNIAETPPVTAPAIASVVTPDPPAALSASPETPIAGTDKSTCWYQDNVSFEMNRFYDQHINGHEIAKHLAPFTSLLALVDPVGNPHLLDLGCGSAMLIPFCKEFRYFGADLPAIVAGCAMRNYPTYFYRGCDIVEGDISWIGEFDVVILNGIIDVMQTPIYVLDRVLKATAKNLIIHRQEIREEKETEVVVGPGYGTFAWHTRINRADFEQIVTANGFKIAAEVSCTFGDWENGGSSFLLQR